LDPGAPELSAGRSIPAIGRQRSISYHQAMKKRQSRKTVTQSSRTTNPLCASVPLCLSASLVKPFQKSLTTWYHKTKRDLPWRHTSDPYAIFVSELMLQQTQVATVIPFYNRFLQRFPTVQTLAAADLQEVLGLWAGLGYYRRARHLHQAAQDVVNKHAGLFPSTAAGLLTLPGIGRYTAGAIASIAFNAPAAILDGNVMRVLARVTNLQEDISLPQTQAKLWSLAETLTPARDPGSYNQALMELGATICSPRNPQCMLCPIQSLCRSLTQGTQNEVPIKKVKTKAKTVRRCALVVRDREMILLLQRPRGVIWEELWEFPSLEIPQLNSRSQISDEVQRQLGLSVAMDQWESRLEHQLTHRTMKYRIVRGQLVERTDGVRLPKCDAGHYVDFRWVHQRALHTLPVGRITHKLAAAALDQTGT
jgi:A/G-specific adenine glycosylase